MAPFTANTSLALDERQYYHTIVPKNLLVLHHTVGGTAASTVGWWERTPERIGTAYLIERDGTVYEVFPPEKWAHHIGKGSTLHDNQRSIGIELCSEGALLEKNGKFYAFDRISVATERSPDEVEDIGFVWRGRRYFQKYTPAQLQACFEVVNVLCERFAIPRVGLTPAAAYIPQWHEFKGIIGHCHARADKTDVHPKFDWAGLYEHCNILPIEV